MTRLRTAFLLGAALMVTAAVALVVALVDGDEDPASTVAGFHRLSFSSGGGALNLGTGTWVGYYEVAARRGSPVIVPNFRAFIRDPRGEQVNVGNYTDGRTGALPVGFDYRGKHGVAILRFDAPRAGRYRIQLQSAGRSEPGADLAIGRDLANPAAESHTAFVVSAVAAVAGIGLLGWGFVRRSRRPHVVSGAA